MPTYSSAPQLTPPTLKIKGKAESPVKMSNTILDPLVEDSSPKKIEEGSRALGATPSSGVVKRETSEESKRHRRIKTKSKVETVL